MRRIPPGYTHADVARLLVVSTREMEAERGHSVQAGAMIETMQEFYPELTQLQAAKLLVLAVREEMKPKD